MSRLKVAVVSVVLIIVFLMIGVIGYNSGYMAGEVQGSKIQANGDNKTLSSEEASNKKLTDQYNSLQAQYTTLRNAIIQYLGSRATTSLHCTSMSNGYSVSTNCF